MPVISRFYGIIIKMFFSDHLPPHFHAIYGEYNALFDINTLDIIEGYLLNRAKKLVVEWSKLYKLELMNMWDSQDITKLPDLQ